MQDPFDEFDCYFDDDEIDSSVETSPNQTINQKQQIPFPKINFNPKNVSEIPKEPIEVETKKNEVIAKLDLTKQTPNNNSSNARIKRKRVPFTPGEDDKLKELVQRLGTGNWVMISNFMPERTPKQCRDRYMNYLHPGYFKCEWSKDEDNLLVKLYYEYGPKWSYLKQFFFGRSPNSLKNRWNYFLSHQQHNFALNFQFPQSQIPSVSNEKQCPASTNFNMQGNDDRTEIPSNNFTEEKDEDKNGNADQNQEKIEDRVLRIVEQENEIFDLINNSIIYNEDDWFLIN